MQRDPSHGLGYFWQRRSPLAVDWFMSLVLGSTVRAVGKVSHRLLGPVAPAVVAGLADARTADVPNLCVAAAHAVRVRCAQTQQCLARRQQITRPT